jgi:hypothetical protein
MYLKHMYLGLPEKWYRYQRCHEEVQEGCQGRLYPWVARSSIPTLQRVAH